MPKSAEKLLTPAQTLKVIEENEKSMEVPGEPLPIPLALANNIKAPAFKKNGLNYCTYTINDSSLICSNVL